MFVNKKSVLSSDKTLAKLAKNPENRPFVLNNVSFCCSFHLYFAMSTKIIIFVKTVVVLAEM